MQKVHFAPGFTGKIDISPTGIVRKDKRSPLSIWEKISKSSLSRGESVRVRAFKARMSKYGALFPHIFYSYPYLFYIALHVFQSNAFARLDAASCLLDSTEESWIVFQAIIEPVVFRHRADNVTSFVWPPFKSIVTGKVCPLPLNGFGRPCRTYRPGGASLNKI
jgi:hypothetical protein